MVRYNPRENQLKIIIPKAGIEELYRYQKGLLNTLGKIEIENCNADFKEDLKSVYELLSHLLLDKAFLSRHKTLLQEFSHRHAPHEKLKVSDR